jgi:hypothetical protein
MKHKLAPVHRALDSVPLTEAVLQFAWAQRRFNAVGLHTTADEAVELLHPGTHNTQQGPDFLNARVRIGEIEFVGSVELHLESKGWMQHSHHLDPGYQSVILHVVLSVGQTGNVNRADGTTIPEVSLAGRLDPNLLEAYTQLMGVASPVPCASQLAQVPPFEARQWVHRQGVARVAAKADRMQSEGNVQTSGVGQGDWPQRLLIELAGGFGGPQNSAAFRVVAAALPMRVLQRHAADLHQIEALLFGLAGQLNEAPTDGYQERLQQTWNYLVGLHSLSIPADLPPLAFLRMRPAGFPTVRLAQLAVVLHRHALTSLGLNLVSLLDASTASLSEWLSAEPSEYWLTHYRFGLTSARKPKVAGQQLHDHMIINVIIPFAYLYHRARGDETAAERAVDRLGEVPAERNATVQEFGRAGLKAQDGLESQGLLHLQRTFCAKRRCLECAIGHYLLRRSKSNIG